MYVFHTFLVGPAHVVALVDARPRAVRHHLVESYCFAEAQAHRVPGPVEGHRGASGRVPVVGAGAELQCA